jgi:hypothetical protein
MQEHNSTSSSASETNTCSMERRGATLSLSNFKFEFNELIVSEASRSKRAFEHAVVDFSLVDDRSLGI